MTVVLLTRPRAASEQLAAELKRLGYDSIVEPLLSIIPTTEPQPDLTGIEAAMITSGNALDVLAHDARMTNLPCFCVGRQTAEKAYAFGFREVYDAAGDGAALAKLTGQKMRSRARSILHIAGRDIDSTAQDELQRMGFSVTIWPVYAATPSDRLSESTVSSLKERKLDAVLIYSARTAETLKALLVRHALEACCASLIAIGISEAAVAVVKLLPWRKLDFVTAPTEESVIKRLQELLPVPGNHD